MKSQASVPMVLMSVWCAIATVIDGKETRPLYVIGLCILVAAAHLGRKDQ